MPDRVYDQGDTVRLEASFQAAGALSDPTTIVLTITDPAGNVTTRNWPTPADITKVAVGRFRYDHALAAAAAIGDWQAKWVTTGVPALTEFAYFTVRAEPRQDLVRSVRGLMKDRPHRFYVNDNPLSAGALVINTSPLGDASKISHSGLWLEFDDGTDELAVSSAPGDATAGTVPILRGQDGTAGRSHVQGTAVLVEARLRRREILDAARQIVDLELWPHVWVPGEIALAYQASTTYYVSTVPDIEEVVLAYQVVAGEIYGLDASYLPPVLADEANFPNGAIIVPRTVDASAIRLAYRARPTLGNLTEELRALTELGVCARLQLLEESGGVAPDAGTLHASIVPGARARAAVFEWQSFTDARSRHQQSLLAAEDHRRRRVNRGVA